MRETQVDDCPSSGVAVLMPSSSESIASANGLPQKRLQSLRSKIRRVGWVLLMVTIRLVVATGAFAIWWLTSLNDLPDIGDPFDVATFRAVRLPDDRNAFTYFRRAAEKLSPMPDLPLPVLRSTPMVSWAKADPMLQAWVEANRQALVMFQKGADQADASLDLTGDPLNSFNGSAVNPGELAELALLEGSRRQESGDSAGAWDCYRAVLRATAHAARRESIQQTRVSAACRWLVQRMAGWVADPRTTIPQLHAALEEAIKAEPRPEWDAYALKIRYLQTMRELDRPMSPYVREEIEGESTYRRGDWQVPIAVIETGESARRFLQREPERSRRVLRLVYSHWLAHVATRGRQLRKPVMRIQLTALKSASITLYSVSPDAPAGARALPPRELANWLVTTRDAKLLLLWANSHGDPWPPNHMYREAHSALVVLIATELYRRENGALPASEQTLVGTYLDHLPDDGSSDLADEVTPSVE
jgi:hypothetical protein